jgi:hypothetical protein
MPINRMSSVADDQFVWKITTCDYIKNKNNL